MREGKRLRGGGGLLKPPPPDRIGLTRNRRVYGTANSSKVRGTSDPHGYLWISRVHQDTEDDDMLE